MSLDSIDDWDSHWAKFAASASHNPAQIYRHGTMLRLLQKSGIGAGMRLLDLGSGQGDFMVKAASTWPEATLCGFDMSTTGVEVTRRKLPGAAVLVVDVFQPPAESVPYRDWATHAVCSEVLEHVDDPAKFIRAARSYLADGAALVVTVPGGPMSAFDRHIGHRQHFTRERLSRVLEEGGFKVEEVSRAGFPFFNLYRLTVIARGRKLVEEVQAGADHGSWALVRFVMGIFRFLFRFNFLSTPFGWQVVAVARKASP